MLGSQFVHLSTLGDELGAKLVLSLRINLVLLAQFFKHLT